MNHEVYKFLEYKEILNILLEHCDINYRNPDDNYSTISMVACSMKNFDIIKLIFEKDYTLNIEKKAETLRMGEVDSNDRNLLHYLLAVEDSANFVFPNSNYNAELVIMEILKFLLSNLKETNGNGRINSNPKSKSKNASANLNISLNEVVAKDKDFNTILTLSLTKGLFTVSSYLINERKLITLKPDCSCMIEYLLSNKNNLLHCAVLGRNLKCLNMILSLSIIEDITHKNSDDLSPADLAKSIGFNYFYNVLKFHETNNAMVLKKDYLQTNSIFIDNGKVLNDVFSKENYNESLVLLERLKLTNSLITHSSREKIKYNTQECSINWNILLCKYLINNKGFIHNINIKCETELKSERILNKYVSENVVQNDDFNVFIDYFNNKLPLAFDENDPDSYNKSILLFNKLLFNYKIGDFKGCLKVAFQILNSIMNNEIHSFFLYLNTTIILVEIFINHNLIFLASILIEKLENYLNVKFKEKHNEFMDENISTYLTKAEYLHNSRDKWNDIFALIQLIKAYRDTLSSYHEVQLDTSTCIDYFNNYEKIENSIKSDKSDKKPIYNSLKIISESIKAKIAYLDSFLHYVEFNSITNEMNNRINSNDHVKQKKENDKYNIFINQYPLNMSVCREYRLFYLNSHGIVLLKQKKYNLAETFFQSGITFFNKSNFTNIELKDYTFALKLQHLYSLKYNLGLTYFYQKKFKDAKMVFLKLSESKNSQVIRHLFLWYRIGICNLELFKEKCFNKNNEEFINETKKVCNYLGKDNDSIYDTFLNWPYKFILKTEEISSYDQELLKEAILAFKQIIVLINTDVFSDYHLNGKMINNIYSLYTQNATSKISELMKLINCNYKSKAHVEVIVNTYLNLIFSLICLKQWNEVLFYIDKFKLSEYFKIYFDQNKTIDSKLNMYKIVALLNLKQYNLAKNVILTLINSKTYSLAEELQEFKCLSKFSNSFSQKEISFHISILVNFAKLNYNQGNYEEGDKVLNAIINKLYILRVPEIDYPIFVINLILFSLLHKGLTSLVIKIVKYKKIFEVLQEVKLLKNNK